MNNSYVINYLGFSATVDSTALPKDQRQGIENFEKTKEEMWKSSVTPKIIQSDSTAGILGDLGLDVSISRRIVSSFEFSLAASLTAKKDNPNNKASASLVWRTPILHATNHVAGIRANISIQDDATQSLVFHDLSVRLFASVYLRPFEGIQPIFFTAGLDEASRIRTESGSPNYDDPRIHAQVQWGFIGLLGKGSAFHIDWTYWERLGNLGKPNIDPTEPKKRTFVALEFEYPIATDKNVTVKYADGSVAPTFSKSTSVQLGLQIFLGDWNLVGKE